MLKKITYIIAAVIMVTADADAQSVDQVLGKVQVDMFQNARVQEHDGYLVFNLSKPAEPYKVMGEIKTGMTLAGSPKECFNDLLRRLKKNYPKADGMIITSIDMDKAEAIVFLHPEQRYTYH